MCFGRDGCHKHCEANERRRVVWVLKLKSVSGGEIHTDIVSEIAVQKALKAVDAAGGLAGGLPLGRSMSRRGPTLTVG